MKNIIIACFVMQVIMLHAQFGGTSTKKDLETRFLKTKTLVVKTGDDHFDQNLEAGFKKHWTITEYKMVEPDFKIDEKDKSISYVKPFTITVRDSYTEQTYVRYGVFMGGSESTDFLLAADIVLDGFGSEGKLIESAYRAGGMAKMMQDFIQLRLDGEPISGSAITRVRYTAGAVYNKRSGEIRKKTLLVDKNQLTQGEYAIGRKQTFSEADFKALYGGKVEFVSTEEVEEAINSGNPEYCYFLPVYSRNKFLFVVDCESGSVLYNGYSVGGMFMTKKDIKALGKAITQ